MRRINLIKKTLLAIVLTGLFSVIVTAQEQAQTQGKSEATIELSYFKKADLTKSALAVIKVKNSEGKFVSAKDVRINFYVLHSKEQQLLKSTVSDNSGHATIALQNDLPLDDSLYFTIVAKIENDNLYEDAQATMHYKDASLTLNLNLQDTARLVTVKVMETGKNGKEIPVKNAEIKFYVQRLFGMMPAAEENSITTDENGEASFAFPKNIPGDTAGSITIAARMEDNEQFGNVENKDDASWGVALIKEKDPFPRALWEPSAPIALVITISTLFGGVWCVYFFVFYQMHKINKAIKEKAKII